MTVETQLVYSFMDRSFIRVDNFRIWDVTQKILKIAFFRRERGQLIGLIIFFSLADHCRLKKSFKYISRIFIQYLGATQSHNTVNDSVYIPYITCIPDDGLVVNASPQWLFFNFLHYIAVGFGCRRKFFINEHSITAVGLNCSVSIYGLLSRSVVLPARLLHAGPA